MEQDSNTGRISEIGFNIAIIPTLADFGYGVTREPNVINHFDIKTVKGIELTRVHIGTTDTHALDSRLKDYDLGFFYGKHDGIGNYYFFFIDNTHVPTFISTIKRKHADSYLTIKAEQVTYCWALPKENLLKLWLKVKAKHRIEQAEEEGLFATNNLFEAESVIDYKIKVLRSLGWNIGAYVAEIYYLIDMPSWTLITQDDEAYEWLKEDGSAYLITTYSGGRAYYLTKEECGAAFRMVRDKLKAKGDNTVHVHHDGKYLRLAVNNNDEVLGMQHGDKAARILSRELNIMYDNIVKRLNIMPDEETGLKVSSELFESETEPVVTALSVLQKLGIAVDRHESAINPEEKWYIHLPCISFFISSDNLDFPKTTKHFFRKFGGSGDRKKRIYLDKDVAQTDVDMFVELNDCTKVADEMGGNSMLIYDSDNHHAATLRYLTAIAYCTDGQLIWVANELIDDPSLVDPLLGDHATNTLMESHTINTLEILNSIIIE